MIRMTQEKKSPCNKNKSDLKNNISLQRQNLLSSLDEDAMMQLEEVVAASMRRKKEKYVQNHPYAITQGADGRWCTNVYDSSGKRKTIRCSTIEQLHNKIAEHYRKHVQPSER